MSCNRKGFTLAEVLITLAIIGVVASMTIPALQKSMQDSHYQVLYKKAYANLSNALKMAMSQDLLMPRTTLYDDNNLTNYNVIMGNYFSAIKTCDRTNFEECWKLGEDTFGANNFVDIDANRTDIKIYVDNSGMAWINRINGPFVFVDTNSLSGPNVFGKDRFCFAFLNPKYADRFTTIAGSDPSLSGEKVSGYPVKVYPMKDFDSAHVYCKKGNCKYTSWLLN